MMNTKPQYLVLYSEVILSGTYGRHMRLEDKPVSFNVVLISDITMNQSMLTHLQQSVSGR